MNHVTPERLLILAKHDGQEATPQEIEHFAQCPECQQLLKQERMLTAFLISWSSATVPENFSQKVQQRFLDRQVKRTTAHQRWSYLGLSAMGLFGVIACVAFLFATVVLQLIPTILASVMHLFSQMVIILQALVLVVAKVPFLFFLVAGASICALMVSVCLTQKLFKHLMLVN